VTPLRILFVSSDRRKHGAFLAHLSFVAKTEYKSGWFEAELFITLRDTHAPSSHAPSAPASSLLCVTIPSKSEAAAFDKALSQSLRGRVWCEALAAAPIGKSAPVLTAIPALGIGSIFRGSTHQRAAEATRISSALSDLDSLMNEAQTMVSLAKKMGSSLHSTAGERQDSDSLEFASMLRDLGVDASVASPSPSSAHVAASPATVHASADTAFHKQLCTQVDGLMGAVLANNGGIFSVSDAYCVLNRARGTDLVSPDDFVRVCRQSRSFDVATLPSGVLVLRTHEFCAPGAMTARILRAFDQRHAADGMGELEAAAALRLSLPLALQVLLDAEQAGVLCRDEGGSGGVTFWRNVFVF
jgi:ESCRT-II complex subunit VPS36